MAGNMNRLMCIHAELGTANDDYVVTRGFEIVDANCCTTTSQVGSTVTIATNIGGAGLSTCIATMAADTADDMERAATIVADQATLTTGDTVRFAVAGSAAADLCDCFILVIPTTWIAG